MHFLSQSFASRLKSLIILDLSKNSFYVIPQAVEQIPTLQELNLSKNVDLQLLLDQDIGLLKSLKNLELLQLDKGRKENGAEYTWSGACMRVMQMITKTFPNLIVEV